MCSFSHRKGKKTKKNTVTEVQKAPSRPELLVIAAAQRERRRLEGQKEKRNEGADTS